MQKTKMKMKMKIGGETHFTGVTILLSLTVFLNLVAESMPTTSDAVPLIGIVEKTLPNQKSNV